jgi:hypothetical protein
LQSSAKGLDAPARQADRSLFELGTALRSVIMAFVQSGRSTVEIAKAVVTLTFTIPRLYKQLNEVSEAVTTITRLSTRIMSGIQGSTAKPE